MLEKASGWVGSFFYAICFLPQMIAIWKNKSPELNMNFMFLQFLGASFMFLYGLTNNLYPILILNAFAWVCIITIIGGFYRNKMCKNSNDELAEPPPSPPFLPENDLEGT